jgi:hypothetical protein
MLKLDTKQLDQLDKDHPGIRETILQFEAAQLPACPHCDSRDTAKVQCGIVGRTINIAAATTKLKLIANGPTPAEYFCNSCDEFFG